MLYVFATIDNGIPKTDRILDCTLYDDKIEEQMIEEEIKWGDNKCSTP